MRQKKQQITITMVEVLILFYVSFDDSKNKCFSFISVQKLNRVLFVNCSRKISAPDPFWFKKINIFPLNTWESSSYLPCYLLWFW